MSLAPIVTQPMPACSEHELVAAVRRGSDPAFEELYSRYRQRIGSYVHGMVGDHGRAEDVVQDVFMSALARLRDTDCPIAFKPWIYEIAKNASIDDFRRNRRIREVPLETDDAEAGGRWLSRSPTPDAAIQSKQSLADLRGAFRGLSDSHHQAIVMRELEGLSYDAIGARLGMSRQGVESTLFRARRRLSEEYDELVSGRRCQQVQTMIAGEERRSLLKLGVRQRRRLARHLAHCQPCRREARMAGVDESFFKAPQTLAGKIAALLPIPWLRGRRSGGEDAAAGAGSHSYGALKGLQTVSQLVDPAGPTIGFGRAAAAAAAIAVAGIGGGVVTGAVGSHSQPVNPAVRVHASPAAHITAVQRTALGPRAAHRHHSSSGGGTSGGGGSSTKAGSAGGGSGGASHSPPSSGGSSGSGGTAGSRGTGSTGAGTSHTSGGSTAGGSADASHAQGGSVSVQVPGLPKVNVPVPQLPKLPPLPKVSLPPVPKVSVPGVVKQASDAVKQLGGLLHPKG